MVSGIVRVASYTHTKRSLVKCCYNGTHSGWLLHFN